MKEKEFWESRADGYNELQWVRDQKFMNELVRMGEFSNTDMVLDVGTGTGVVAKAVSELVQHVTAIDISRAMIDRRVTNGRVRYVQGDMLTLPFDNEVFDRVTARYVFHHILEGIDTAMDECFRVVKPGGLLILAEGVPPSAVVKEDFINIFKLKEERLTFMENDLVILMANAGFRNIKVSTIILNQMSVRNWLEKSGLPEEIQATIYDLHKRAGQYFKDAYNMVETEDDCLIDMKVAILSGEK